MGIAPAAAFADASSSVGGFGPVNGYSYYNQATLYNSNSNWVDGSTNTWTQCNCNAPAGWIGSDGRVFTSGGSLVADSGYNYTSSSAAGLVIGTHYSGSHGTFYSYGISAAWNGSSYNDVYTYTSPLQNW